MKLVSIHSRQITLSETGKKNNVSSTNILTHAHWYVPLYILYIIMYAIEYSNLFTMYTLQYLFENTIRVLH